MKQATVTINYESFQAIKAKADMCEQYEKMVNGAATEKDQFIDELCHAIEKANCQTELQHKQYFIAQGMRAICKHFDMELDDLQEGRKFDEGVAPGK